MKKLFVVIIMAFNLFSVHLGMAQVVDMNWLYFNSDNLEVSSAMQNNLCNSSEPFCTDNGMYEFPAGVNAGSGELGPYYDCLRTTPNPAWYYMRILDSGDMDIYMYSTPQVDLDFCCWGPYDDPIEPCPSDLTRQKVVSCSYSTDLNETCEIRNAEQGQYYILLITNYYNQPCNIHFSKVAGDATTDCSILAPLLSYDEPICAGQDLALYANGLSGSNYHWFQVGGSWTSNEQNPVRPHATVDMSGTYGCAISQLGGQSDTTYLDVVVVENYHYYYETVECNSFICGGEVFDESGDYTLTIETPSGCDSVVELKVDMNYTPLFEIQGAHWPIGGSETHISVNEYAIQLDDSRTQVDTVMWQIDCPNWNVEPHGIGMTATLTIYTYLLEPVTLHAWTVNRCDTVHEEFFIQTSYFDVEENAQDAGFVIAPNPTDGNMTLYFGQLSGMAEIQVFNAQGQKVDAFSVDANLHHEMVYQLPLAKNGTYYFVMDDGNKKVARKVVVAH